MADLHGFVVRNDAEEVVGVDEGLIAVALLKGQKELLSEMVQSQWGPVHLFDLCLRCDHLGMALALAAHGVPGCVLEDYHLGPFSQYSCSHWARPCSCQGWDRCHYCCWAFPVEQGIWMEDWNEALFDFDDEGEPTLGAIPTALEAAATPVTRAMLDICSRDMEVPFSGSPKAMVRLLDIAILTGNQKAAVNLAKKCQVRPLRRWAMNCNYLGMGMEECWEAAKTALWAGADFRDLMVEYRSEQFPFRQALFLNSELEDWQELRHLLPQCHDLWRPRNCNNNLGQSFLGFHEPDGCWKLSVGKIHSAEDAGVDVRFCCVCLCDHVSIGVAAADVTLLDMAIWSGQPRCAAACVDRGIDLKDDDTALAWHKQVLRGESLRVGTMYYHPHVDLDLDVVPSEAQIAAAAAGCAWLKRIWKSESSQKGIVLYQFMLKMFKGRPFPMVLVQEILTFSMPVPKILDQLDLWEHVGAWVATICGGPAFVHAATDYNTADVEEPEGMHDIGEAGSSVSPPPVPAETVDANVKTNDDLMMALQASRDQVPALNFHGVCVFRLTRLATSAHVSDLLLNASGPLASLHQRVLEAGCQVDPEWNPVKVLFIPITEAQMDELISLAEQGYELNKEDHILALQEDEPIITEALRSHLCKKHRPTLKKVGPECQPDEDVPMEENDPLLVRETGLRTDSSVGFPSYSG